MEEAIYHLRVKITSRAKGESAVSRAAYRSGTCLADERTGVVFDYRRKGGVLHQELIFGAGWEVVDRETLWNHAESLEKRKNSTTAREFEITLPLGLSPEGRVEVARDFTRYLVDRFGFAADLTIHQPDKWNRGRRANLEYENIHAHIFCTTRDASGKKTRALDDKKSGAILEVREKWAEICNSALERAGCEARISATRKPLEEYNANIVKFDEELTRITAEGDRKLAEITAEAARLEMGRPGMGTVSTFRMRVSGRESQRDSQQIAESSVQRAGGLHPGASGKSLRRGGRIRISEKSAGKAEFNGIRDIFDQRKLENLGWQITDWISIGRAQKDILMTQRTRDEQKDRY